MMFVHRVYGGDAVVFKGPDLRQGDRWGSVRATGGEASGRPHSCHSGAGRNLTEILTCVRMTRGMASGRQVGKRQGDHILVIPAQAGT